MRESKNIKEDTILMAAIRNDNMDAYNKLFKKYYPSLCTYCYRFVPINEVEDIVQDVMIWVWENRKEEIIKTSLDQYLFRMVYNRSINKINQNEVKIRVENFFHEHIIGYEYNTDEVHLNELMKITNEAIENLPSQYKEAFIMHRFKEMSYKEIAENLQVSPKTVDYRIQQALKILRLSLRDYLPLLLPLIH